MTGLFYAKCAAGLNKATGTDGQFAQSISGKSLFSLRRPTYRRGLSSLTQEGN
jgi:hypothetical protein